MIELATYENFDSLIAEGFTLVDFYSVTCGPCKILSKISLSDFADEVAGLHYDSEADWLWVTDSRKSLMYICKVDGTLLASYDISFIDNAESICVDRPAGIVWVGSDEKETKLYRIDFEF